MTIYQGKLLIFGHRTGKLVLEGVEALNRRNLERNMENMHYLSFNLNNCFVSSQ